MLVPITVSATYSSLHGLAIPAFGLNGPNSATFQRRCRLSDDLGIEPDLIWGTRCVPHKIDAVDSADTLSNTLRIY